MMMQNFKKALMQKHFDQKPDFEQCQVEVLSYEKNNLGVD